MATIVKHKETGRSYVLLGAGFGLYRSSRPGIVFGNLSPKDEHGEVRAIAVCDEAGVIAWVRSKDLEVVQVDGVSPAQLLTDRQ